jgi:hypothetical protein
LVLLSVAKHQTIRTDEEGGLISWMEISVEEFLAARPDQIYLLRRVLRIEGSNISIRSENQSGLTISIDDSSVETEVLV